MATIVTRAGKGSPLTNNEVDANFTNLNDDKLESGSTASSLTITSADINGGTIDGVTIGGASAGAGTFTTLTTGSMTTTGDVTFGDNDKAIFGAGSDLQIYHDGSDSIINDNGTGSLKLQTGASTKLEVTSSGIDVTGKVASNTANDVAAVLNRQLSHGNMLQFKKDGATVGTIGNATATAFGLDIDGIVSYVGINTWDNGNGGGVRFYGKLYSSSPRMIPVTDNSFDIGAAAMRFDDIYATNGTIQTSDRNEKQDIEALSDAEQRVAVAAKGLLRKYRWKDAVAEKGDAARIHFGIIAQDLQAAFEAEGLDAGRYGMFTSSTWWEAEVERTREVEQEDGTTITKTYTEKETYEEPTEGAIERTRLGVRYPELLAFIIAAL